MLGNNDNAGLIMLESNQPSMLHFEDNNNNNNNSNIFESQTEPTWISENKNKKKGL